MSKKHIDIADDLTFTKIERRTSAGGAWAVGTVAGHRFDALVFPEHAENPDYEIGDSRISKLWLKRLANDRTVFNWDRGMDVPAADRAAKAVVDFLCAGLAEAVFAGDPAVETHHVGGMTAKEAVRKAASMPGHSAILLAGQRLVVPTEQARLMETAGAEFAYLCIAKKNGKVVTVPVNS
jgi:hypothetical protein